MAYIGQSPSIGEFKKLDDISGLFNDSNTTFALTVNNSSVVPGSEQALLISIDGVLQEPGTAYFLSGTNLVFTAAPNTSSTFFGVQLGSVGQVGVPTDGTVTSAKLAANAVTLAKIATNAVDTGQLVNDAVTSAKILNGAVTGDKLDVDAVTTTKILNGAVTGQKLTGNIQLSGATVYLGGAIEKANVVSSSVSSNIEINNTQEGVVYFVGETDSNKSVTINFLNLSNVTVGNVASYAVIITNNATNNAFISTALVDGAAANVLKFIEGTPTGGSANIDVYTFSVIKTNTFDYTVLGSKSEFRT